jgi:hypothetical protein
MRTSLTTSYRLILPLATHPIVESAEDADRERWLISEAPPEVAYALAGPSAAEYVDVADLAQLSLNEPLERPRPRPTPSYIL